MSDIECLQKIKDVVEQYNKQQQLDILKIFIKDSVNISENSNGTFINLTDIQDSTIKKIQEYINFINIQNIKLIDIETTRKDIESSFFDKKKLLKSSEKLLE
ncbi:hypothetical protein ceV_304 [Chrysochromulina ericina virus CeV-01B]|jgi:hypothetical protein|uniref:NET domain-containing protein n=1 Tax=Chrysochromulina ericina virus CeV-01B TaxID=3070830 RepID=A0A0N9QXH7_9VIRU|nr:hypothetical protein ceV_304 [Chrysochromulina ericina virus]ALH23210.1 hypothetical protein ceV_304 [Chrysochromulina ericina virus CeV-01B]